MIPSRVKRKIHRVFQPLLSLSFSVEEEGNARESEQTSESCPREIIKRNVDERHDSLGFYLEMRATKKSRMRGDEENLMGSSSFSSLAPTPFLSPTLSPSLSSTFYRYQIAERLFRVAQVHDFALRDHGRALSIYQQALNCCLVQEKGETKRKKKGRKEGERGGTESSKPPNSLAADILLCLSMAELTLRHKLRSSLSIFPFLRDAVDTIRHALTYDESHVGCHISLGMLLDAKGDYVRVPRNDLSHSFFFVRLFFLSRPSLYSSHLSYYYYS